MKSKRQTRSHSQKRVGVVTDGDRGEPPSRLEQLFASCCNGCCCWSRRRRRCKFPSSSALRDLPSHIGRRLRDCFSNVSSLRAVVTLMCVSMIIVAGGVALGVSLTYTLSAAEDYAIRFVTAISDKGKQKFEDFIDIPLRKAISYQYAVEQGRFPLPINKTIDQRATDFNFWLDTFYTAFNETDNQLMFFSLGMQDESYFDCYSDVYPVIVCRIRDSVNLTNISTTPAGSFAKSFYVKRVDLRSGAVLSEQWSSTTYTPLARPWYWQVNHTHGAKSWTRVSLESTNLVPIIDINAACFSPVGFSGPSAGQTFSGVFSFSFRLAFLSVYLAELQRTKGAHILLVDNDNFLLATTISGKLLPIAYYVNYSAMSLQTTTQADINQNGGAIDPITQPFRQNAFGVSAGGGGASADGRTTAPRLTPAGACTAVARLSAWYCREHVDTYGVTYFADMKRKIDTTKDYAPQKIRLRGSNFFVNNISYLHSLGQYLGALAVAQPTMVNLSSIESLATAATVARGGGTGTNDDAAPLQRAGYPTASQPTATDDFYASVTAVRSLSGAENMYWRVLTLIPESDITEKIIEGRNYAIYVVTGVVVVCMVLALVGTWALLRPLREMATLMYVASTFQRNAGGAKNTAKSGDNNQDQKNQGDEDADAVIRNPSALVELKQLQLAFITLSDQITRARQYLPATLLQGPNTTATATTELSRSSRQSSVYSRGSSRSASAAGTAGFSEGDLDEDDFNNEDGDGDDYGWGDDLESDSDGRGGDASTRRLHNSQILRNKSDCQDARTASDGWDGSTPTEVDGEEDGEGDEEVARSVLLRERVGVRKTKKYSNGKLSSNVPSDVNTVKSFRSSCAASATPTPTARSSSSSTSPSTTSSRASSSASFSNRDHDATAMMMTRRRQHRLDQLVSTVAFDTPTANKKKITTKKAPDVDGGKLCPSSSLSPSSPVEKRRSRLFLLQQQQSQQQLLLPGQAALSSSFSLYPSSTNTQQNNQGFQDTHDNGSNLRSRIPANEQYSPSPTQVLPNTACSTTAVVDIFAMSSQTSLPSSVLLHPTASTTATGQHPQQSPSALTAAASEQMNNINSNCAPLVVEKQQKKKLERGERSGTRKNGKHPENKNKKKTSGGPAATTSHSTTVAALRSDLGLIRRRVTVLYINVSNFQRPALDAFGGMGGGTSSPTQERRVPLPSSYSWFGHESSRIDPTSRHHCNADELFVKQFSRLVTAVSAAAEAARGVLDSFHGDRFVVTFNAARPCASHAVGAVTAAKKLLEQQGPRCTIKHPTGRIVDATSAPEPCRLRCGVATGIAVVGNLGSDNTRRFCTIGPVYGHAALLERLCLYYSKRSRSSGVEVPLLMSEATLVDAETVHPVLYVDAIPRPLPQATQGPYRAAHAEAVRKAESFPVGRCMPLVPLALIGTIILPDDDLVDDHRDNAANEDEAIGRSRFGGGRGDGNADTSPHGGRGSSTPTPPPPAQKSRTATNNNNKKDKDDEWMYQIEEASSAARPENALNDILSLSLREHNQYALRFNRVWLEAMRLMAEGMTAHINSSTHPTATAAGGRSGGSGSRGAKYPRSTEISVIEHHGGGQVPSPRLIRGRGEDGDEDTNKDSCAHQAIATTEEDERGKVGLSSTAQEQQQSLQQQYDLLRNALAAANRIAAETATNTAACLKQVYTALQPLEASAEGKEERLQQQPPSTAPPLFTLSHLPRRRIAPLFHAIATDVRRVTCASSGTSNSASNSNHDDPTQKDECVAPLHAQLLLSMMREGGKEGGTRPFSSLLDSSPSCPHHDNCSHNENDDIDNSCFCSCKQQTRAGATLRGFPLGSFFEDCLLKPF